MKKLITLACPVLWFLLSSCSSTEKYQTNNAAGDAWLQVNNKAPVHAKFGGVYYSPHWGLAFLRQRNGKIDGYLGFYYIKGIVSARTAYLLLIDDGWIEYTMILRRKGYDTLEGVYSSRVPFSAKHSGDVQLDRIID